MSNTEPAVLHPNVSRLAKRLGCERNFSVRPTGRLPNDGNPIGSDLFCRVSIQRQDDMDAPYSNVIGNYFGKSQ